MADLQRWLGDFGAEPADVRLLADDGPELLPYATLVSARRNGGTPLDVVEGVYEWQGAPLAFAVAADSLDDREHLHRVRRLLAMRGDAPYLAVAAPGRLDVYGVALDGKTVPEARVDWEGEEAPGPAAFSRLGNLRPGVASTQRNRVSNVVARLLSHSTKTLIDAGVSDEDAISLVGRALFTRFLADRRLLPDETADPVAAAGMFDGLSGRARHVVGDIARRAPAGRLFEGWEEGWGSLDFAHIPAAVLIQAFALHLEDRAPTPKPIAELMVAAAFRELGRRGLGRSARVLDPAVGCGVFLAAAFRELAAARWRADGKRPGADELGRILSEQLVGFGVNEAALRFAALGLHLMSIELDPDPRPVDKPKFDDLRGKVLHLATESAGVGGRYDVVVGNPPWTSPTGPPGWDFVRRAMEWAKPDGQIALALPARLLFQQRAGMPAARQALFESLAVSSIINGADLRETNVWPGGAAPFCILLATNRAPGPRGTFRFISPQREESLNRAGAMRVDALGGEIVSNRELRVTPAVLKTLFRGTKADFEIVERIRMQGHPTLAEALRGRSASEDPEAGLVGRYLDVVRGSKLAVWFALLTSGEFGVDGDVVEEATLDSLPVPDFEKLTEQQRGEIRELAGEADEWVMRLYGLGERASHVVADALECGLPSARNRQAAQAAPTSAERETFCEFLRRELEPWSIRFGSTLVVEQAPPPPLSPWHAVQVRNPGGGPEADVGERDWELLLLVADQSAAPETLLQDRPDRLMVARLAQRRYWSRTQARLLAGRIAREHLDLLKGRAGSANLAPGPVRV